MGATTVYCVEHCFGYEVGKSYEARRGIAATINGAEKYCYNVFSNSLNVYQRFEEGPFHHHFESVDKFRQRQINSIIE